MKRSLLPLHPLQRKWRNKRKYAEKNLFSNISAIILRQSKRKLIIGYMFIHYLTNLIL